MSNINGFTFYKNYYEIIKYLNHKDRLILYEAIFEYMFEEKEPQLKELLKGIWVNIKMPLDNNKKNIINGQKGGRPKDNEKPKENPKETQIITQEKPNKQPKGKANNISYFLFLISNFKFNYIIYNTKIYNKIIDWLKYKEERKEIYKETGLKSLLSQIENQIDIYGEDEIVDLIDECMANNYKGIIFDKLKGKKKRETIPNWFSESIKETKMTTEEEQELDNLLKDFK